MKTDFVLYKGNTNTPIVVNEKSNTDLLKRCQDNWYHTLDIKYNTKKKWYQSLGIRTFKSQYKDVEFLFIHIPKTGGISFKFNVIYNPHFSKKIAIYHKFKYPPVNTPELDIFNEDKKLFTLLRDPTKTVISAYFHFNHFLKMSIEDFCENFSNIQIKFLLGYDICSSYEVTLKDVNSIKQLINDKKLTVGIYKTKKMEDIYNLLGLALDKVDDYVLNKKTGIKYKYRDIPKGLKQQIKKQKPFRLYVI
jgi:hypothetical protein